MCTSSSHCYYVAPLSNTSAKHVGVQRFVKNARLFSLKNVYLNNHIFIYVFVRFQTSDLSEQNHFQKS